jgi:hypothetical protein
MGESRSRTPHSASCTSNSRVAAGETGDMPSTIDPARTPSITGDGSPSAPISAALSSSVAVTQVIVTSLRAATSEGDSPTLAPCSAASSDHARVRLQTVISKPALSRLRTIGAPMIPSPMNPTESATIVPPLPCRILVTHHAADTTVPAMVPALRDRLPRETIMGRLLKRLVLLGIVGVVAYRALVALGIVGDDEEVIEFEWDDEN